MFFKKIIQKNIKLLAVLAVVVGFLNIYPNQVIGAADTTLGKYQYKTYDNGEVYYTQSPSFGGLGGDLVSNTADTTITENTGTYIFSNSGAIRSIVVSDSEGNKIKLNFDSSGFLNQIYDGKNGKEYNAKTGGANMGNIEMQNSLNDLARVSGYKGNLYQDVVKQRNIFYNNQLIEKLQSGEKCTNDSITFMSAISTEANNGIITENESRQIKNAMVTGDGWTPTLAQKFKGALNNNLGAVETYFFFDESQKAIECAFISAASQGDKDKAIVTLQALNQTGGNIKDLTSDQLNNLVNTTNAGVVSGGGVGSATAVADEVSGAVNQASRDDANESLEKCFVLHGFFQFKINPSACFAEFLYFILSILAFFLGVVGLFFNLVFDVTLVNMKENVNGIGIVSAGWATIRDFANILFIFMLLYLAISTILQLDDHGVKHGLSRLIVGAVLINFSLFFVKIPIDISNILAIEIYDAMTEEGAPDTAGEVSFGLGDTIMAMFSPQQVFDNSSLDPKTINDATAQKGKSPNEIGWNLQKNPVTTFAMGIIIIFTALLIFLAVCIIFIKRFITLVILMIFSPLAFAGMAIPNHDIEHQISSKFWSSLLKESFYAPVFMFMMYLTIKTGTAINKLGENGLAGSGGGMLADFTSVPVSNVISYSVVMGMMIFSLTVSESMGVKGASGAIKFFDSARGSAAGWAWKNTGGQLAYNLLEKTDFGTRTLKGLRQGVIINKDGTSSRINNALLRGIARGVGNSVSGGLTKAGEGHHHDIERDVATTKDTLNELRDDPAEQAALIGEMMAGHKAELGKNFTGLIHPYDQKVAKYVGTSMKDDEVATLALYMRKAGKNEEADTLLNYLGKERKANIDEMISNKVTKFHRNELGSMAEGLNHIEEYKKTGEVSKDNGHGGVDKLTGEKAVQFLNEKYTAGLTSLAITDHTKATDAQVVAKIQDMYDKFSEKQKTEVLSTLSNAQQKMLASNPDFVNLMEKHFTNYRMMDQAMKGSMAKELQEQLGYVAYKGAAKYRIDTALRAPKFIEKLNSADPVEKRAAEDLKLKLTTEWQTLYGKAWKETYDPAIPAEAEEETKIKKMIADYKTLLQAERNFSRVAAENDEYKKAVSLTDKYIGDKGELK